MRKIIITTIVSAAIVAVFGAGCSAKSGKKGDEIPKLTLSTFDTAHGELLTTEYTTVANQIYDAAKQDDAVTVVQLCRQMNNSPEQDAYQLHDHDMLVGPCNSVINSGHPRSIMGDLATMGVQVDIDPKDRQLSPDEIPKLTPGAALVRNSGELLTTEYTTVANQIYDAAKQDDAVAVVQLCRQMNNSPEQDASRLHDHDLLRGPCNSVISGGHPRTIMGDLAIMGVYLDPHRQRSPSLSTQPAKTDKGILVCKDGHVVHILNGKSTDFGSLSTCFPGETLNLNDY